MQICAPLTRSQCKVSDTQVTIRPVGLLFIEAFQIHHQISLFLLNSIHFYNQCYNFYSCIFENKVINEYTRNIMWNSNINAQVCINYTLWQI